MPSIHYDNLLTAHRQLRTVLRGIDPVECKTDHQRLKLQGFILLAHAQLEQYLEDLVLEIATEARNKVKSDGTITKALMGLISSGLVEEVNENKSNRKIVDRLFRDIANFSVEAYSRFLSVVDGNNGIKLHNLCSLFYPIGISPEKIDIVLCNSLDAFGTKRGDIAHKFAISRDETVSSVTGQLDVIIAGLKFLDEAAWESLSAKIS